MNRMLIKMKYIRMILIIFPIKNEISNPFIFKFFHFSERSND